MNVKELLKEIDVQLHAADLRPVLEAMDDVRIKDDDIGGTIKAIVPLLKYARGLVEAFTEALLDVEADEEADPGRRTMATMMLTSLDECADSMTCDETPHSEDR